MVDHSKGADQVVVVDTGSTDKTVELAESHGAEIHHFPWTDDFAAARNYALDQATGSWVLSLDADETLDPKTAPKLRILMNRSLGHSGLRAWGLAIHNVHDKEGILLKYVSHGKRLFPNHPKVRWVRPIHEQLVHIENDALLQHIVTDDVILHHQGYLSAEHAAKGKEERNRRLLLKALAADPDDPFNYFHLGQEHEAEATLNELFFLNAGSLEQLNYILISVLTFAVTNLIQMITP